MRILFFISFVFFVGVNAAAQNCTTRGQTPKSAFPVCATTSFNQTTVPICGSTNLAVPGCSGDGAGYQDKNPFWYKFTCFESGTLGFLITPNNKGDDYDWQLYDITGRDPDDVFTDPSLIVTGNWAGTYGLTGTSNKGVSFIQCASDPSAKKNSFAKMPHLVKGHTYLLLVSHFTDSQSGYALSFGGGTAVITDPEKPHLKALAVNCAYDELRLSLTKKISCNSIAADGSDFSITAPGVNVTGAKGFQCDSQFDNDSIFIKLSQPLAPGVYTLNIKPGSDGNTLLDNCENAVAATESLTIEIKDREPAKLVGIEPVFCAPNAITVRFDKSILCNTIAADGSNFRIDGPSPVTITSIKTICTDNYTPLVTLQFSEPLKTGGRFTVSLQKDLYGNLPIDECGEITAPSTVRFITKDTVNPAFSAQILWGCEKDSIAVTHNGNHEANEWLWDLDDGQLGYQQQATGVYRNFTTKNIKLIVSNGFCTDSSSQTVELNNFLLADFDVAPDLCPNDSVQFHSLAQGTVSSHAWAFGDGGTASDSSVTHKYAQLQMDRNYTVQYTVTNWLGCQSTREKVVTVYSNCDIRVPDAFTPNGDGLNDFIAPLNAVKAANASFKIFNRWGQLIYETSNWKKGWDGKIKGQPQNAGTYVWLLQYTHHATGKKIMQKGTVILIR